jgi:CheY-like chemotaxis protein
MSPVGEEPTMATATPEKQILIADPSERFRHSLCQFLRTKGFGVIDTSDGSRALAETLLKRPDILLLDLSVEALGAERLVQILRTNPTTKSIPIFFMSEEEKSVPGFRAGIDDFIRKPFRGEEVLLRIQRTLFRKDSRDAVAVDSEISGNLAQIFLPDLWQMLSLKAKSGVIQVEGEGMEGSIYIEKGEIVSARARNTTGEKALYRLISLKKGKFRFLPGKVEVRRTIYISSQQAVLEGLRHLDEIKNLSEDLPAPNDSVILSKNARSVTGGSGVVREVILLAEFCNTVKDIVENCSYPDLAVYETLLQLRKRGVLRIGMFEVSREKSDFLPPENLARLRTRIEESGAFSESGEGRIVLFLPTSELLERVVLSLGQIREFELDSAYFSLRREEGFPIGMFGKIRIGEGSHLLLYVFPYIRSTSPLWYALAPRPLGVVAFLKDEVSSSLDALLAVSDYTTGTEAREVLAVMGKSFTNFGLGENTIRMFQSRVEKLGCSLRIQRLEQISPEEIREAFVQVVRQYLREEPG